MTRTEIIEMIKDGWTRALMDEKDIREDIAESYAAWVQGLIAKAAPELSGQAAVGGQAGGEQGGPAAGDRQGGMPQDQMAAAEGEMQ